MYFKRSLSIPMCVTVVWLLWVLEKQVTVVSFWMVVISCLVFAIYAFVKHEKVIQYVNVVLLMSVLMASLTTYFNPLQTITHFDEQIIDQYRKQAKGVFVNVTARWCVTCQYNKRVLGSADVKTLFRDYNVVYVEADFTNYDDDILRFMKRYNRRAVPTYFYFSPSGNVDVLPEILTIEDIETVLKQP